MASGLVFENFSVITRSFLNYNIRGGLDRVREFDGKRRTWIDQKKELGSTQEFIQLLVVILRMLEVNEFNPARKKLKTPFLRKANRPPSFLKTNTHHKSCLLSSTQPQPLGYLQQLQAKTIEKSINRLSPNIDHQLIRKKSSLIQLGLRHIHLQEKYASLLEKTNNLACKTQQNFEETSNTDRAVSNRKRLDRLKTIQVRLANIRLPHYFTTSPRKNRWSRSLK